MAGTVELQVEGLVLAGATFVADVFVQRADPDSTGIIELEQASGPSSPPVRRRRSVVTSTTGRASASFEDLVLTTRGTHTFVARFRDCQPGVADVVVS